MRAKSGRPARTPTALPHPGRGSRGGRRLGEALRALLDPASRRAGQPGALISFLFSEGQLDTTVTWRLEAAEDGTVPHLEHQGFRLDTPMGQQAFEGMGNGWPGLLSRIDGVLSGVS